MLKLPEMPGVNYEVTALSGGFDQITPSYQLAPGSMRDCLNFACRSQGGYYRIPGYERFDGRPEPHNATFLTIDIELDPGKYIAVGDVGLFGNVSGTIAYIDPAGKYVGLTKTTVTFSTVTFVPGPIVINADTKGQATGVESMLDLKKIAQIKAAAANIYRADIQAVPGSGPIRGVMYFKNIAYAFRDNEAGTQGLMWRATDGGWVQVMLGSVVPFSGAGEVPVPDDILTQGGVTGEVERVVIVTGDLTNSTAEGYLILANITGGDFIAGAATYQGSKTITLTGPSVAITRYPGGKCNFNVGNFSASPGAECIYGADGMNDAFEFDGIVYVPIFLDVGYAKPTYVVAHANHLFLSVESSLFHSAIGNPYNFEVILGAGEIGTGGAITGMLILPGDGNSATLQVTSRSSTWVLYGNSAADWKFVSFNVGVGALDRTLQNLFDAFSADDHGISIMKQSLNYGNFDAARITYNIQRFIRDMQGQLACSGLSRSNSQYRLFYENGFGIYSTVTPQGVIGHGIVLFPHPVVCAFDGENTTSGQAYNMFGTADGYVMRNDVGTSFDGAKISAYLNTNINTEKTPRLRKRFRRAMLEVQSEHYMEAQFTYSFDWASRFILPHAILVHKGDLSGLSFWDNMIWDAFFWDGRTETSIPLELEGTGENIQFMVISESDYIEAYTLNSVLFHYTGRRGDR